MEWKYFEPEFEYEKSFQDSERPWAGHKQFAYDLVSNLKPNSIVELGTAHGTSFFSFCQAVKDRCLKTKLFAVDLWQGDKHSGYYGDGVYNDVKKLIEAYYPALDIKLIKMSFDDASSEFGTKSIDILHIDGLHTYEAVKHDFELWIDKVADNGIVLIHDTEVSEKDFGVYRYWDELKKDYSTLEFFHSFGLGVLFKNRMFGDSLKKTEREWQRHYSYRHEISKLKRVDSVCGVRQIEVTLGT